MSFDIISVGDPTIDTFLDVHDASVTCNIDRSACKLCFDYAEKIPVNKLRRLVAGNCANNAIGSSRLGLKAAYYMIVGADDNGKWIADTLKKEKVADDYFVFDKKNPTNASTVINFKGERTILVYHAPRTYKLPKLKKSKWLYYSSVNKGHRTLNGSVLKHVAKHGIKLCYNPGTYQRLEGAKQMQRVASKTYATFVNVQEAQDLTESKSFKIPTLLKKMKALGMHTAIITDGAAGSYAYDGTAMWHVGTPPTPVIERTGAGDAFATTLIVQLHHGKPLPDAMAIATCNSSSVIMKIGPQEGLLKPKQLERFFKKYKKQLSIKKIG